MRLIRLKLDWRRACHVEMLLVDLFDFELSFGRSRQDPRLVRFLVLLDLDLSLIFFDEVWERFSLLDDVESQVSWFLFWRLSVFYLLIG